MNWTSFLLTLTLVYLLYYGLNLLFDLFISRRKPAPDEAGETLFFEEHTTPELIDYQEPAETEASEPTSDPAPETLPEPQQPPVTASGSQGIASAFLHATGAVGLRQLFTLAKDDLIEHTRAIPYG